MGTHSVKSRTYWNVIQKLAVLSSASLLVFFVILNGVSPANLTPRRPAHRETTSTYAQNRTTGVSNNKVEFGLQPTHHWPQNADAIIQSDIVLAAADDGIEAALVKTRTIRKRHVAGDVKVPCQPVPRELLRKILGPAYNPRYMSFDRPDTSEEDAAAASGRPAADGLELVVAGKTVNQKDQGWLHEQHPSRHHHGRRRKVEAFHVHEGYTRILYEEPVLLDEYYHDSRQLDVNNSYSYQVSNDAQQLEPMSIERSSPTTEKSTNQGTRTLHSKPSFKKTSDRAKQLQKSAAVLASSSKEHLVAAEDSHFKVDDDEFEQVEPPPPPPPVAEQQHDDYDSLQTSEEKKEEDDSLQRTASQSFINLIRGKRGVKSGFPWACESKIEWINLGHNYFPRFLRMVVCTSAKCWFGHFQCRPKAFTVKVLRRRKDSCIVPAAAALSFSAAGAMFEQGGAESVVEHLEDINSYVPEEFREQWIFEERAVTSCCDCAV